MQYAIGCDIGGTFTDLVLAGTDGSVRTHKVSSSPDDYSRGIVEGIDELLREAGVAAGWVESVSHATTVATNTLLEHKGARTGLITTKGFRDVLEMRRLRIPVLYDLQYDKPPPLVRRRFRREVAERTRWDGSIETPIDAREVAEAAAFLRDAGVTAVAIAFLHSYANPENERRAAAIVRAVMGDGAYVTLSSEILPEIREYERSSTAVVNAYVGPTVRHYLDTLSGKLGKLGISGSLRIMQSNGGVMSAAAAVAKPAYIVESGPAAGVIACARVARHAGLENVISFDMGGTTAKAAIVESGRPAVTTEYEIGAGINLSSKLVKGGGYAVKLPFIDVSEIGAGGGSLVSIDSGGSLRVGPESAGAVPGPACYGLGNDAPTFTDAMVVLGYLNPLYLIGGRLKIHRSLAEAAIRDKVAIPLALSPLDAAHGVFSIAVATMTRAVKAVSTYRGRDPRDFALMAFGGNGPIAAAAVARELGIRTILIPPAPGVFSALGLLYSDIEQSHQVPFVRRADSVRPKEIEAAFAAAESHARAEFTRELQAGASPAIRRSIDFRYSGQAYELTVAVSDGPIDLPAMVEEFHREHERTYGHRSHADPVAIVNLRLTVSVPQRTDNDAEAMPRAGTAVAGERQACFGPRFGLRAAPVIGRGALSSEWRPGPFIVEEFDATCVVPPDARGCRDARGNIVLELTGAP